MSLSNGTMKIAYVVTRADSVGGAQVHILDLAQALLLEGHEVTVLIGGDGPVIDALQQRGIPYHSIRHLAKPLRPGADLRATIELCQALRTIRPQLVAAHTAKAGMLARGAAALSGIPAVFTPHGWAISDRVSARSGRVFKLLERLGGYFSARIINVCEYERGLALRHKIAPEAKLSVVHNGIPDIGSSLLAQPDREPPILITIARFEEPKDYRTLLCALSGLKDLTWTIDLVGDGPLQPAMESLARDLGLAERMQFLGARRNTAWLLAQAQLFVLSTRSEAFPYSVLEGMRAGLPVVSSDAGGIREAVADGETGMLVTAKDASQLQGQLRRLILDAQLRRRLGAAGRRRFLEQFTVDKMVNQTVQIYREVISAHPVGAQRAPAPPDKRKWHGIPAHGKHENSQILIEKR